MSPLHFSMGLVPSLPAQVEDDARIEEDNEFECLAHDLAAEHSKAVIEALALFEGKYFPQRWIMRDLLPPSCTNELRYLELRKLIREHPTQPNLFQLLEEPCETEEPRTPDRRQ